MTRRRNSQQQETIMQRGYTIIVIITIVDTPICRASSTIATRFFPSILNWVSTKTRSSAQIVPRGGRRVFVSRQFSHSRRFVCPRCLYFPPNICVIIIIINHRHHKLFPRRNIDNGPSDTVTKWTATFSILQDVLQKTRISSWAETSTAVETRPLLIIRFPSV